MLNENTKEECLQLIHNVQDRLTQMSFKLEDMEMSESEWNYYSDQFIKMFLRLSNLEELVINL